MPPPYGADVARRGSRRGREPTGIAAVGFVSCGVKKVASPVKGSMLGRGTVGGPTHLSDGPTPVHDKEIR